MQTYCRRQSMNNSKSTCNEDFLKSKSVYIELQMMESLLDQGRDDGKKLFQQKTRNTVKKTQLEKRVQNKEAHLNSSKIPRVALSSSNSKRSSRMTPKKARNDHISPPRQYYVRQGGSLKKMVVKRIQIPSSSLDNRKKTEKKNESGGKDTNKLVQAFKSSEYQKVRGCKLGENKSTEINPKTEKKFVTSGISKVRKNIITKPINPLPLKGNNKQNKSMKLVQKRVEKCKQKRKGDSFLLSKSIENGKLASESQWMSIYDPILEQMERKNGQTMIKEIQNHMKIAMQFQSSPKKKLQKPVHKQSSFFEVEDPQINFANEFLPFQLDDPIRKSCFSPSYNKEN